MNTAPRGNMTNLNPKRTQRCNQSSLVGTLKGMFPLYSLVYALCALYVPIRTGHGIWDFSRISGALRRGGRLMDGPLWLPQSSVWKKENQKWKNEKKKWKMSKMKMKDWKNEWLNIFKNQSLNIWISMIEIEKPVFEVFNDWFLNCSIIDIFHFSFFIFEN